MESVAEWRHDLDALQFAAEDGGACLVHRLAFRSLLGRIPRREDCLGFFGTHAPAFAAAARYRIAEDGLYTRRNFHLTSRQIRRSIRQAEAGS